MRKSSWHLREGHCGVARRTKPKSIESDVIQDTSGCFRHVLQLQICRRLKGPGFRHLRPWCRTRGLFPLTHSRLFRKRQVFYLRLDSLQACEIVDCWCRWGRRSLVRCHNVAPFDRVWSLRWGLHHRTRCVGVYSVNSIALVYLLGPGRWVRGCELWEVSEIWNSTCTSLSGWKCGGKRRRRLGWARVWPLADHRHPGKRSNALCRGRCRPQVQTYYRSTGCKWGIIAVVAHELLRKSYRIR